jgi:sialic acid synthase SpsE
MKELELTFTEKNESVVNFFKENNFKNFVLMHCVSEYPHTLERSQIGFIKTLKQYQCEVGFSDHTMNSHAATAAVSLGATWIEKHYTLSRELGGLDSSHSLEFPEMLNFCKIIKSLNKALGVRKRIFTKEEKLTRQRARRGVYFNSKVKKNSIIQKKDLLIVRPETNFDIWDLEKVIGKKTKKNFKKYSSLSIRDVV